MLLLHVENTKSPYHGRGDTPQTNPPPPLGPPSYFRFLYFILKSWQVWYLPDLAPSDYYMFPNMQKHLAGKQLWTDDEVISAVEDFFEDQDESFYPTGIQALQHQWKKFVNRRGDYVEK